MMDWWCYLIAIVFTGLGVLNTWACWNIYKSGGPLYSSRRHVPPPPTYEEWRKSNVDLFDTSYTNRRAAQRNRVRSSLLTGVPAGRCVRRVNCNCDCVCVPDPDGLGALSQMG